MKNEPYELAGKRLVFTNWFFVKSQNGHDWCNKEGSYPGIMADYSLANDEISWNSKDAVYGIRLRTEKALRYGPLFNNEKPWEKKGLSATILKDNGIYKAWCTTGWHFERNLPDNFLCYFESKDGYEWERPDCGLIEYEGSFKNNLLSHEQGWRLHNGGVFVDPAAPESERYKWLNEEIFSKEELCSYSPIYWDILESDLDAATIKSKWPAFWGYPKGMDKMAKRKDGLLLGVRGAVSADGIKWDYIKEPLVLILSDTHVTAYYDAKLKKYVGYFRDWIGEKRVISRAESDDFRNFQLPEIVLTPDLNWSPNCQLYTNCRTTIPDAPDQHLMFPSVWDTSDDTTHIVAASSYDGKTWQYIPGDSVLETSESGKWDGGCIFAYPELMEMSNGDFVLPYTGYNVPHKYPRGMAERNSGYAIWPKGRLICIEAEELGEFTTIAFVPQGDKLRINAVTKRSGYIKVEVCKINGEPVPGREIVHSAQLFGDCYRALVTWKDCSTLGIEKSEAVCLHIKMKQACIYGMEFS